MTETIHVEPVESYVGHTGHGVALGAHRLGLRTTFADVSGDDPEGLLIRATYDELGLPFHAVVHPSGTRRAVNLVSPDGRRLSLYDGRHPASLRVDPALWRQHLDGLRHAHVSIMDFARHALPTWSTPIARSRPTCTIGTGTTRITGTSRTPPIWSSSPPAL